MSQNNHNKQLQKHAVSATPGGLCSRLCWLCYGLFGILFERNSTLALQVRVTCRFFSFSCLSKCHFLGTILRIILGQKNRLTGNEESEWWLHRQRCGSLMYGVNHQTSYKTCCVCRPMWPVFSIVLAVLWPFCIYVEETQVSCHKRWLVVSFAFHLPACAVLSALSCEYSRVKESSDWDEEGECNDQTSNDVAV